LYYLQLPNKSQEPPKPEATPAEEPAAPEPAAKKPVAAKPLPKVGNVVITVKDIWAKQPIKDAIVNVTVNEIMRMVKTDTAGKALFKNLPFGSYTFTVSSPHDISESDTVTTNVTVPRGETATKTVSLRIRQ
jgi:hypothetical protein